MTYIIDKIINYKYKEDKLIQELNLPIAVECLNADQSAFFKTVYQNPARDNSKQFLDREQ